MEKQLKFSEALSLVRKETIKGEALELIAKLAEKKQISKETEEELDNYINEAFE